ncbi:MAG: hypothetical protein V1861_06260 [Candidatus Micrarchaeota archaeon]
MDYHEIKRRLTNEAFLYPPMEPLEPQGFEPQKAMSDLLLRCAVLSGMATQHLDSLKNWLARLISRNDVAFYGSVISNSSRTSDIDLMVFPSSDRLSLANTPNYIHTYKVLDGEVSAQASVYLVGPLLFPDLPDIDTLRRIEAERRLLASLPFFNGGMGEVLTYSAFKVTESGPTDDVCEKDFPVRLRFRLDWRWFDSANMRMVTHTPHELNEQIREQMRELRDPEVHALAMAAMRRLRVRESSRAMLAETFVTELRSTRARG